MSDISEILAKLERIRSEQAEIGRLIIEAILRTGPHSANRESTTFTGSSLTLFDRLPKA